MLTSIQLLLTRLTHPGMTTPVTPSKFARLNASPRNRHSRLFSFDTAVSLLGCGAVGLIYFGSHYR